MNENDKLNQLEYDRLKKCTISRRQLHTIDMNSIGCSICYDRFTNLREKIISVPQCKHVFHWK